MRGWNGARADVAARFDWAFFRFPGRVIPAGGLGFNAHAAGGGVGKAALQAFLPDALLLLFTAFAAHMETLHLLGQGIFFVGPGIGFPAVLGHGVYDRRGGLGLICRRKVIVIFRQVRAAEKAPGQCGAVPASALRTSHACVPPCIQH